MLQSGGFISLADWQKFREFQDIVFPYLIPIEAGMVPANEEEQEEVWPDILSKREKSSTGEPASVNAPAMVTDGAVSEETDEEDQNSAFLSDPDEEGATCTISLYFTQTADHTIYFAVDPLMLGRDDISVHDDRLIITLTEARISEHYCPDDDNLDDEYD